MATCQITLTGETIGTVAAEIWATHSR